MLIVSIMKMSTMN